MLSRVKHFIKIYKNLFKKFFCAASLPNTAFLRILQNPCVPKSRRRSLRISIKQFSPKTYFNKRILCSKTSRYKLFGTYIHSLRKIFYIDLFLIIHFSASISTTIISTPIFFISHHFMYISPCVKSP